MGQYPLAEYLLFEVLYFVSFYPTQQRTYRIAVLATMICLTTQIYLTQEVMDMVWLQYRVGFMVATRLMFIAYILFAEGSFPNHWRRVRDEVHAESDTGDLDKMPSDFPLTKKLWWMADIAYGMRMIGWVQEPRNCMPPHPTTFAPNLPQEDLLEINHERHHCRPYDLRTRSEPTIRLPRTRPRRRSGDLPRRGPALAPCTLCPSMDHRNGDFAERYTQCWGFSARGPRSLEPHTVAGHLGQLGRRIHCAQILGVRTFMTFRLHPSNDQTCFRKTWHQQLRLVRALPLFLCHAVF